MKAEVDSIIHKLTDELLAGKLTPAEYAEAILRLNDWANELRALLLAKSKPEPEPKPTLRVIDGGKQ